MKELSIEEKAKRYDEAIKVAADIKAGTATYITAGTPVIDAIFPELKESEDEKIRKWIIAYLENRVMNTSITDEKDNCLNAIRWLEKQGEHKPTIEMITPEESLGIDSDTYNKIVDECIYGEQKPAWSEEDDKMVDLISKDLDELEEKSSWKYIDEQVNWLKSLKDRVSQKQEWSEEDKEMIDNIIDYMMPMPIFFESTNGKSGKEYTQEFIKNATKWLKSLNPQNTWKPSEQQMKVLNEVINFAADHGTMRWNDYIYNVLKGLREQLKKL